MDSGPHQGDYQGNQHTVSHPIATTFIPWVIEESPDTQELNSKAQVHYSSSQEENIPNIYHPAINGVFLAMIQYHCRTLNPPHP